jgi:hypothetical protein
VLKEQEERNKTKLEEKEEEITRLKTEKEDMKVDDEIRKSFETICYNPKLHHTCIFGIRPSYLLSFPSLH